MDTSLPVIALKQLAGNEPTFLYPLQEFLLPYVDALSHAWLLVWVLTAIVLTYRLVREYQRTRATRL